MATEGDEAADRPKAAAAKRRGSRAKGLLIALGVIFVPAILLFAVLSFMRAPPASRAAYSASYGAARNYQLAALPQARVEAQRSTPAAQERQQAAARKAGTLGKRPSDPAPPQQQTAGAAARGAREEEGARPGVHPVRAWVNRTPQFTVPSRAAITCTPEEGYTTEGEGPVSCVVEYPVRSEDGSNILMWGGTVLEGWQGQASYQGTKRMVVAFDRARGIHHERIPLKGIGADELGRNGVDGVYNDHLWEKIKGGAILATIEAATGAAVGAAQAAAATGTGAFINFGGFGSRARGSMAQSALEQDYRRRPSIERDHADTITVKIVGDLDLSNIYENRLVDHRPEERRRRPDR